MASGETASWVLKALLLFLGDASGENGLVLDEASAEKGSPRELEPFMTMAWVVLACWIKGFCGGGGRNKEEAR